MKPGILVHAFNPALGRLKQGNLCEFEARLLSRMSSVTPNTLRDTHSALVTAAGPTCRGASTQSLTLSLAQALKL